MSYAYLNNIVLDELLYESTNDTVSAAGATQLTATPLTDTYNVVTTVPASTGVALPTPNTNFDIQYGDKCIIVNRGANTLNVYPPLGAQIDSLGLNNPFVLPVDGRIMFDSSSTTQWYTIASYNTLSFANEGGGAGTFDTIAGLTAYFRSLVGTANGLTVTQNATTITMDNTLTGSNIGTGTGTLFSAKSGAFLEFNSLAGTANGLTVSAPSSGTITIDNTLTGSNVGAGTGIFSAKSGASLQFNTLAAGTGLSISGPTANVITLANTGVLSVTGTTNQVTASPTTGAVVVSTPSQFVAPGTIQDTTGMLYSTSATVSAAGATQGTATGLTTSYNVVTTVAASTGVRLPTITATNVGYTMNIINKGANPLNIYPATGAAIDGAAVNTAIILPVNASITLDASSTTQWFTINPPVIAGANMTVTYGNGATTVAVSGTHSITYPISTDQLTVNNTVTSTSYFTVWDNTRFGVYTTRTVVMWVVPSSGTRSVTVAIVNNGGATLGSTTIPGGSATGLYSFTFTAPGANTRLDLTVVRSAGTAPDPIIYGINMDLS